MRFAIILFTALLLDALLGDPHCLPHPVSLIGRVISILETRLYPSSQSSNSIKFIRGIELCAGTILITFLLTEAVIRAAAWLSPRFLLPAAHVYLIYAAVAWRSLKDETLPVARALFDGNLNAARAALSNVVGRDTKNLDASSVSRAAVETIAENSVDGVFSVIFYAALGYAIYGLEGMAILVWLFKAVSTLDSMVGYYDERYREFGRASARLDDVLNFIPARIGGIVIILSGGILGYGVKNAFHVFLRDRKKHKSPNSAHGESAFAGVLGVRLGGGAAYGGVWEPRPWLGDESSRDTESADIIRAHRLLDVSAVMFAAVAAALSLAL